jgi:hypothetical protein
MRRAPIRIRTFLLGSVLALLLLPTLAGGAAWLIERDHQQADSRQRLNTAVAYLTSHRTRMRERSTVQGFARLLGRLDLLGQLVVATETPPGKTQLYVSPALQQDPAFLKARQSGAAPATAPADTSGAWTQDRRRAIAVGPPKSRTTLAVDLYYRRPSRATRALVALVSGVLVLLAGLAVAIWLAGGGWSFRSPG